jgi:excinuclease ABC subunit A
LNDAIIIRGARTHNLKDISCEIPHGKLTVVSGVSGSGKSSLAFDTIYAEGQRRYVESLSAYARQFLERIEKPDVDLIDGLAPAIAIKQKNTTRNPRSTVATATEIYDYLRLLYARCGTVHCVFCDGLVKRDSMDEVAEAMLALGEGTRLQALFPVASAMPEAEAGAKPVKAAGRAAKAGAKAKPAANGGDSPHTETLKARLTELRTKGFNRLYQQGKVVEFSTPESLLDLDFTLPVFVLLDRIVVSPENRSRIVDAAETAYRESGQVVFEEVPRESADGDETQARKRHRFSGEYECKSCHRPGKEPEPRLFSFNNPFGACPRCQGFGNTVDFDLNLVIPDKELSLNGGAQVPVVVHGFAQAGRRVGHTHGRTVARDAGGGAGDCVARQGRVCRRVWIFCADGAQEIQAACAGDAEQVSGLCGVPGLPRAAAAGGGAVGSNRDSETWRQKHLPGDGADHCAGEGVL